MNLSTVHHTASRVFFMLALVTILAACSSPAPKTIYTTISPATLKAGDKIPAPTGDSILTVTGKIGTTNNESSIKMDLKTIESAGQVEYKVTDPFDQKDVVFRGVLVSTLLDLWQVSKDATKLHVVALNDYSVDVPISELRKYPVLFALQQDGQYMPVKTRGPAMFVFPYNDFTFDQVVVNNYWAWQIKSIDVQ
jgi:hypothetical protein